MPEPERNPQQKLPPSAERMLRQVESKQERMIRGREHKNAVLRSIALLGVIGWSVVLPTLVGVAAGAWMDGRWPSRFSWTLVLMTAGLVLGCTNAWLYIRRHQP
ncbi:MAG TPA: AtpZ/AtpI family protein [Candidatus Angelobacter sp.]